MKVIEKFPNEVRVMDPIFIELKDGIRLAPSIYHIAVKMARRIVMLQRIRISQDTDMLRLELI